MSLGFRKTATAIGRCINRRRDTIFFYSSLALGLVAAEICSDPGQFGFRMAALAAFICDART